jgi:tight adherence protein B
VLPAVAAAAAVLVVRGLSGALLALTAGLAGWAVAWLRDRGRRHRAGEERRRQSVEACDALVAELLGGRPPGRALGRVAEDHPALGPAARACDLGGDVPAALRAGDLPALAAAWQVAEDCGCPLAPTLERVADALRAEEATRTEVASALAPARATARLLAVLPVFGLLLGAGLGGDPLGLLLGSPAGHGLLLGGVLLSLTGTVWVERIAGEVQVF